MMFGISGYVVKILEKGFVLKLEKEMPNIFWRFPQLHKIMRNLLPNQTASTQIVSTQVKGSKLGLQIGDYVSVMGGQDKNSDVFLSSTASKKTASGAWEKVLINDIDFISEG